MLSIRVPPMELNISAFPPVLRDWVIKGLGMSSLVYATGHIKDPVPLIEKRRSYTIVCSHPEDGLRSRQGVKPPLKLKKKNQKTHGENNSSNLFHPAHSSALVTNSKAARHLYFRPPLVYFGQNETYHLDTMPYSSTISDTGS